MDAKRESRLNMYHQLVELCENNLVTIALIVAFQTSYNAFKTIVQAIVVAQTTLDMQGTGGTAKKVSKRSLASMGAGIAGMVYAYASVNNDEDLKDAMRINFTKIFKALDDDVVSICNTIYSTANGLGAALNDYGVSAALLTTFQNAIADYAGKAPKPRQTRAQKRAVLLQVKQMHASADTILHEQLDKLVVNFMLNGHADFELQYRAATTLISPGSFSTVLKILVLNSANQEPLRNAKSYRDASPAIKRSTIKGFVTYKDIEEGPHSFVIKHKLFGDLNLSNVMIAHGHKMTVTAMMIPKGGTGTPAGDPPGFDITEYPIPAGGFVVLPLPNPIPPGVQFYFRAIGGNAVICSTNLPASPCVTGYQLNAGTPFQGLVGGLGLNLTLTHLQITNPGGDDIVVRAGSN
jgi:hypothetical protein